MVKKVEGDEEGGLPTTVGGTDPGMTTQYFAGVGCAFSTVILCIAYMTYANTKDLENSPAAAPVVAAPAAAPSPYTCAEHTGTEKFWNTKALASFVPLLGQTPDYATRSRTIPDDCHRNKLTFTPVGKTTALIPEATDAKYSAVDSDGVPTGIVDESLLKDGGNGDVDFPFGDFKAIATVGEYHSDNQVVVGVPDGMGAYLVDATTIRVIVQSESYGTVHGYEAYPFTVNAGTTGATFTGSHVQYIDYDRDKMRFFMENAASADTMIKGMGELIIDAKNLAGDDVAKRVVGGPTATGAHFSNTNAAGAWQLKTTPNFADWIMMSLCSAHLEEKYQWAVAGKPNIGLPSRMFVTNEEWMNYASSDTVTEVVGLPAHAVDLDGTTADSAIGTSWALGSMTQGGFEKIIEFSTGEENYVAFAVSGYNGAFGGLKTADFVARRQTLAGNRAASQAKADGTNAWVWPKNIVPARIYIGMKGRKDDCTAETTPTFLGKNGLRCGQMYGFATDMSATGANSVDGLYRDAWHKDVAKAVKGATVTGKFLPIKWHWGSAAGGSPTAIKNFEADGSWDFQDAPMHAPNTNYQFWTAKGPNEDGKKTEHCSPAYIDATPSAFTQTSTAGYFGDYIMENLATELGGGMTAMTTRTMFPQTIDAKYYMWQGETDITSLIDLGGKGKRADGADHLKNCDNHGDDGLCVGEKSTFEDIDGFDVVTSAEGRYALIFEDSGNDYGERALIAKLDPTAGTALSYKWMAQSGGSHNTRMLAKAGIPAGVNPGSGTHEFSGTIDLSGMLKYKADNSGYELATAGDIADGAKKHAQEKATSINDKLIVVGLQCHNFVSGIIYWLAGDRGGQWLVYKPKGL